MNRRTTAYRIEGSVAMSHFDEDTNPISAGGEEDSSHFTTRPYTRRSVLRAGGAFGLAIAGGGLLARSGSGAIFAEEATSGSSAIQPGLGKQIANLLGVTPADTKLVANKTWKLGAALPLTGQGASYGITQGRGVHLALEHIALAGGPKINYMEMDHKSGDAATGARIGRVFGAAGVGAQITSFIAILGAEVPSIGQYKMLSFDGGGGVGAFLGKPYFWGTRAQPPQQIFGGEFAWLAKAHPAMKRVLFVYPDEGAATTADYFANINPAVKQSGQQIVASVKYPYGATDFSAAIRAIQAAPQFDVIKLVGYGTDSGYFMKQYAAAGLKTQVLGSELTSDAVTIAGQAYEGLWVAFDYFDYNHPPNPLSKIFVAAYKKKYGAMKPDNYFTANYYESTLGLWELMRRVARKGGDINSGQALQNELLANPTIKSVYGGSSSTLGSMTFNTKTHGLRSRPCGVFKINGGKPVLMATFDISPPPNYKLKIIS